MVYMCYSSLIQVLAGTDMLACMGRQEPVRRERHFMSKSSSEATEKPGTGILRMARVNSNLYVNSEIEKIYGKLAICGQILYIDIRDQSHS